MVYDYYLRLTNSLKLNIQLVLSTDINGNGRLSELLFAYYYCKGFIYRSFRICGPTGLQNTSCLGQSF
jgi:hypothetical protein